MTLANILGRSAERETVDQLLAAAHAGRSGALVLRGEAGIGKTALLEHARHRAAPSGFRVESALGVESEMQFAFAGLHQLCAPLLDGAAALPEPQRSALGVAFGRQGGPVPNRFLVGLATLNLLADVAEAEPLLCLIDDAQWLDEASAQVLAFVARRLVAERVALVFARRDISEDDVLTSLPELRLGGLGDAEARSLLAAAVGAPLDDGVRDRVVAEARGNPLALLELPRAADVAQLAGGFDVPGELDVPRRVEASFQLRSSTLPTATQLLLLIAAAEPTGDVGLLWRAGSELGVPSTAAAPAEAAGLLEVGSRVRFRHPLVRSAVYRAASLPDRRSVHGALAAATDPERDPDRRAWHRARAVVGTDEPAAAELERSAGRARARGGLAASAAFLQQSAELSPDPGDRATRALEAAYAKHEAGAPDAAMAMLEIAAVGPLDALHEARVELLRAQITFHRTRDHQAPGMLLRAAQKLAPLDASLSRETYLRAIDAAIIVGLGRGAVDVAAAARAAPTARGEPGPADLLLDGWVTTLTEGYEASAPVMRRALAGLCSAVPGADGEQDGRAWLWLAGRTAVALFDDESIFTLAERNVRLSRETGALATLPGALIFQSAALVLTGELGRAAELAAEEQEITQAIGAVPLNHARLVVAAWRGQETATAALYADSMREAAARMGGTETSFAQYALAVLHNGSGRYEDARAAASGACETNELPHSNLALPELVEAAARADHAAQASDATELLAVRARASGTQWALGIAARSRALTSAGPIADRFYREAIERLGRSRITSYLARTHLVYGEWLRREGHRQDARDQLRTAHELLSAMGAEAFAERAATELRATGEHPRSRTAQPTDALTEHELHIARLVATGATSREVGAQLFLSPRTIEAHLRNIFRKLGITSRRQLKELPLP